jgi:hypothetical protein
MHRLVVALLLVAGCNSNPSSTDDGGPDLMVTYAGDLANYGLDLRLPGRDPTDHPPLFLMDFNGGPVIPKIEIWTVVWQGDEALGQRIDQFTKWMVESDDYWVHSLGEYGVGKGKAMGVIVIPNAAPATLDDSAFSPLIKNAIASALFPAPNSNTLFQFIVPPTTKSTLYGSAGCQEYGGYHSETRIAAGSMTLVPYAVNLQCSGFGGTSFDGLTEVVSHEASEVATDPHPFSRPAWVSPGEVAPQGGEVSDLCAGLSAAFTVQQDGGGDAGLVPTTYYVTRNWSNKAVEAHNLDPCQPLPPGKKFFNVAVDPIEIVIETDAKGNGVFAAEFKPFSFGDVGTIKWASNGSGGEGITIDPVSGSGLAGDTIKLIITVGPTAAAGTYPMRLLVQSQKSGQTQWVSPIIVK